MKVLIVDDDPMSRKLLRTYLEKWGYEVTQAEDGAMGWALFQTDDFPLVIADWMMPEMDGVELVRHIRAHERRGFVYCILLTARSHKEDLVEGMDAGADDFLSKPFDRDELRVRLREGERIVKLERAARTRPGTPGPRPHRRPQPRPRERMTRVVRPGCLFGRGGPGLRDGSPLQGGPPVLQQPQGLGAGGRHGRPQGGRQAYAQRQRKPERQRRPGDDQRRRQAAEKG